MEHILILKRCASCENSALYSGPQMLSNAKVFCSDLCIVLDDLVTPGTWIDAAELMQGGSLCNRPDIWRD
jgi:hypothetical protein